MGVGAIIGAVLWLLALGDLAATAIAVSPDRGVTVGLSPIVPLAIALLLFCAAIVTLERRATVDLRLADLIGDLSIGTATGLFAVAAVLDLPGLLGPGFVLLLVGSVIFGIAGLNGKRRPRWGSALVGIGAGGLLACFLLAAALGVGRLSEFAQTALLSLLLFATGWAWLGVHLALARPTVR